MGGVETRGRRRSVCAALLAAVFLASTALTALTALPASTASAAPSPGGASLSEVQVTRGGVSVILTARTAGGAKIEAASVKATIAGLDVPVSVQPVAQERRVATLLIDTSGSMGAAGMQTVVRAADAFLAAVPKDVYVGVVAFSTVPAVIAAPTRDRAVVRAGIAGLRSRGETSLYDGLATALAQLGATGDRSFILISDGSDTRSRRTLAQTVVTLSKSGVRAQVVGLRTSESQGSVLASLAKAGHGSVSAAGSSAAVSDAFVSAAFTAAAQAFGSQIRVLVSPPPSGGGTQPLVVSVKADGKAFTGSTVVSLAAVSKLSPSASPTLSSSSASRAEPPRKTASDGIFGVASLLWVSLLTISLGLVGVVVAFLMPTYVSRRQRRVEALEGYVTTKSADVSDRSAVTAISASLANLGDKVMDRRRSTPRTQLLLERADLPLRVGEWAVLRAVAVVVGVAGGMFLMHGGSVSTSIGPCLGGLVGALLPGLFLKFAASRRANKFENQLPDVLTLIASSISTGFSLLQALDAVARDADQPSAKEFSRALAETRIGAELTDSLDHLADRMDSKNLRWTAMAIDIQRQVGGNLAETLRNTAATLRDRQSLGRHVKALSAEGRLSAYILIAMPIGIFFYMMAVNRAYVELLWTTMIGMVMSVGGIISLLVGIFWMNKVVKVEV
jgi:tight adherence protein B